MENAQEIKVTLDQIYNLIAIAIATYTTIWVAREGFRIVRQRRVDKQMYDLKSSDITMGKDIVNLSKNFDRLENTSDKKFTEIKQDHKELKQTFEKHILNKKTES